MTRIETRLSGAFVWLGLLTLAVGVGFLFLLGQISSGYDKVDSRLRTVEQSTAAQLETLKAMDRRLESIDQQLAEPGPAPIAPAPKK